MTTTSTGLAWSNIVEGPHSELVGVSLTDSHSCRFELRLRKAGAAAPPLLERREEPRAVGGGAPAVVHVVRCLQFNPRTGFLCDGSRRGACRTCGGGARVALGARSTLRML